MQLVSGFSTLTRTSKIVTATVVLTSLIMLAGTDASAQQGFISDRSAARAGLNVAWATRVGISSKSKLVDWKLVVDENNATTYFVIEYGRRKEVIGQNDISPFGKPYGIEGAKKAAEYRKEDIEYALKNDGKSDVEVKISSYSLPKSTLLVLGSRGQIISLDADTGVTNWTRQVGNSSLPAIGLGASKTHVVVASASTVFCLEFETGRVIWEHSTEHGIDAAPACAGNYLYVPLVNGRLQTFPIDKFGLNSFMLVAQGGVRARPLITDKNVVWTTERGHMNVAPLGDERTVSYRLNTSAPIVSQASYSVNRLVVGCLDGFVYGINEDSGQLEWDVSTGRSVLEAPVAFGEDVYVVTSARELFKIHVSDGIYPKGWQSPLKGIRRIAGFGVDTIYCVDDTGKLIGIDRKSRVVTKSLNGSNIDLLLPNPITDRMYFATKDGFIQCVHEIGSVRPRFLQSDLAMPKPEEEQTMKPEKSETDEENPFGSDADDDMDEENPFGSDDDNPFGGSSSSDDDDENPFGNG